MKNETPQQWNKRKLAETRKARSKRRGVIKTNKPANALPKRLTDLLNFS